MKEVKGKAVARRDAPNQRPLLDRILDVPHLAQVVPRLQPDVLHRVIQSCGLEDCGQLVALATPGQLARVFDLDLWRGRPGADERFDADRFGVWIEVLMESGAAAAAQTLAGIDVDLAIAALAQHARVFDYAALLSPSIDDEDVLTIRAPDDGLGCDVGGYHIVAARADSWDAIVAVLAALDAEHPAYFHRLMRGCRRLSNSTPEVDGLDDLLTDADQVMFDLAVGREQRREKQGYVTPAQARAFLQTSRQLRLGQGAPPPGGPLAQAYFRAIEWATADNANGDSSGVEAASNATLSAEDSAHAVAAVVDLLLDAGVLPKPPRALLGGPQDRAPHLARIEAQIQFTLDRDPAAYSMRSQELAYLANTIMAGCSIQGRPFTAQEASDAAIAVCNLALENWPSQWLQEKALPDDFLVDRDLVSVFQVGWTILHNDVGKYTAERLMEVLAGLRYEDVLIQDGLDALRIELAKHWQAGTPWHARDALDVIMILDTPAWATLLGLLGECPVMPAAIGAASGSRTRTVDALAFEFISENSQIASVRAFMESLPETLRR